VPYSELLVKPMREELTSAGVEELRTAADVDRFMREEGGTALLVVNSVCGCAAGMARPGVRLALA
jgi:putative YphP/YqiW family bacilliredoxin